VTKTKPMENAIEGRRRFLRTVPAAALTGFAVVDLLSDTASAQPHPVGPNNKENYKRIGGEELVTEGKALNAVPGKEGINKVLYQDTNFKLALWNEKETSAEEFEWHETTDHILTIIEGSTKYEVGGTPQGGHLTAPGQWKAPSSPGSTPVTLNKGDVFVIRRGTSHKRVTKGNVIFTLLSPITPIKG
jgi:mannose-6-phosphate isomerase-like protein (cupin superfamily)